MIGGRGMGDGGWGAGGGNPSPRLLVVLPNWYGEALFATPFVQQLRAALPEAFIAGLAVPRVHDVLAHHPAFNALLFYDEDGADRSLAAKWRLADHLRQARFDAAVILRRSASRTALMALAGIRRRIGFDNRKSGWLLTERIAPGAPNRHRAVTYLDVLTAFGIQPTEPPRYRYDVTPEEHEAADRLLESQDIERGRPIVVVHPGANWPHKRWPAERFAQLADRLAQAGNGRALVVTGAPEDQPLADQIARHARTRLRSLVGRTSLRELGACLTRASLIVTNDTGVLHIACALGVPSVALFGPTSPRLTGPLGEPSRIRVIHHPECCPAIPCLEPDGPPHPGMASISVEEVFDASRSLLKGTGDTGQGTGQA